MGFHRGFFCDENSNFEGGSSFGDRNTAVSLWDFCENHQLRVFPIENSVNSSDRHVSLMEGKAYRNLGYVVVDGEQKSQGEKTTVSITTVWDGIKNRRK